MYWEQIKKIQLLISQNLNVGGKKFHQSKIRAMGLEFLHLYIL